MQKGQCECGNISFSLLLPRTLPYYSPRACDCDFCVEHGVAYLSDPEGLLKLKFATASTAEYHQQGDQLARFVGCSQCHSIVAALLTLGDTNLGAVNANLLENADQLAQSTVISPKQLSADEKLSRWQSLWLTVSLDQPDRQGGNQ